MRLYTFCNFYLSSIQQGIQPAHVIADMFVKYQTQYMPGNREAMSLYDWAEYHKTLVCLNGGNAADLRALWETVQRLGKELKLAHGCFHEDEQSLDKTMTCVGIVVPENIYTYNEYERELRKPAPGGTIFDTYQLNPITLNTVEKELAALIAVAPLAR
jgi:hypothetical protein